MRINIFNWVVVFVFILLALGIFNLSVIQGGTFKYLSDKNCIRLLPQEGCRGKILDRNGNLIAGNYLSYDVIILPQERPQVDSLLSKVSGILDISFDNLKKTLKSNFVNSSIPVTIARNIDAKKAIALEEAKFDLAGLAIQPRPLRFYPYGDLACHVLGYLDEIDRWRLTKLQNYGYRQKDIVGFGGVEEKYDYYLRQEEGGLSIEVDHRGRQVRIVGFKPPQDGRDIQLTLDLKAQKIAEEALGDQKGCVLMMDPYTGEIIALVNVPSFNPSIFIRKDNAVMRSLFGDPDAPLVNRAISSSYPPGSVFKLVVAAAALESRKIDLSSFVICNGGLHIGNREFKCWNTHNHQDLITAIADSCDTFFYHTGIRLGAQAIHDFGLKFGFAKATAFDLPYETGGSVPSPLWKKLSKFEKWYDGDTANFSIGQGDLLVTPLQLLRMTSVFANKGKLVNPHIVKAIGGRDVSKYKNKVINLNLKESTVKAIAEGMREVVAGNHGTANILSGVGVSVAGKTGTAQVGRKQNHGWFTGFFPVNKPKYAICVFVEHGGSGQLACVLTKQIIENMLQEGLI